MNNKIEITNLPDNLKGCIDKAVTEINVSVGDAVAINPGINNAPPCVSFTPDSPTDGYISDMLKSWFELVNRAEEKDVRDLELGGFRDRTSEIYLRRGILNTVLPEDYYVNKLPEKSTLPRGKCRKPAIYSIYPKAKVSQ